MFVARPSGFLALFVLLLGTPAVSRGQCMPTWMRGSQVVPPNSSVSAGLAFIHVDTASNTLFYDMTVFGPQLTETVTHIHGYTGPGSNAPIVYTFPPGLNKTGTWTYPEADEAAILAGLAYVDFHSKAYPDGDVRGQIVQDTSDATLYGRLDGEQVVPPQIGSAQTGIVVLHVDTAANVVTHDYMLYSVAGSFGSALNGYAPPGQNGSFLSTLSNFGSGEWNYPQADEGKILAGLTYAENYGAWETWARAQMNLMCTNAPAPARYCTAGTSANGCTAALSASGYPSATAPVGFVLRADQVPGLRNGIFFFGANGRQANPWGNGTSYQCVVPPVSRVGLMVGEGTAGLCDSSFERDLNAHWCPSCPKSNHNPGSGSTVQAQLWYRDPQNTSNQTTSLSDAIEFLVGP